MSLSISEMRDLETPDLCLKASVSRSEDKEGIHLPLNPEVNPDLPGQDRLRGRLLIKTESKQAAKKKKKNPCLTNMETT